MTYAIIHEDEEHFKRFGFHVTFKNGYTVSVQWGLGTYSDNHDRGNQIEIPEEANVAEVAIITPAGKVEEPEGWVLPDELVKIMAKTAKRRKKK